MLSRNFAPVTTRAIAPHERAGLIDLWVAAWRDVFPSIDFLARADWFEEHLAQLENNGARLIGAFDASDFSRAKLAGFVVIDPATGWLDQIVVAPHRKGAGVGAALMRAAREASPARIRLDVNVGNARALDFYAREGFVRIGAGRNPRSGLETLTLQWRPD